MSTSTPAAAGDGAASRRLTLRIYTYAHRLPQTIGKLPGGVSLPWVVGLQQFVVFFATLWVLFQTRRAWGHLGLLGNGVVLLGVPLLLAWLARAAKMQGRGLIRGLMGLGMLAAATATGHAGAAARGTRRRHSSTRLRGRLLTEAPLLGQLDPATTALAASSAVGTPAGTSGGRAASAAPDASAASSSMTLAPADWTPKTAPPAPLERAAAVAPAALVVPGAGMPRGRAARYALYELVDAARLLRAHDAVRDAAYPDMPVLDPAHGQDVVARLATADRSN